MSRMDALWVGLKLLGVYLLVTGAVEVSMGLMELIRSDKSTVADFTERLAYHQLFRGIGSAAAGSALILGAGLFVRMIGERRSVSSPPDAQP